MNYASIKDCDVANGPGVRISLFVSGCNHRCRGCFNQEAWDFSYGEEFTKQVQEQILKMIEPDYIRGLTLLGGEPFERENQKGLLPLLRSVKEKFPQKDIWCFTGFIFERDILEDMCSKWDETKEMLQYIDVLVDGPFIEDKKDWSLQFRGSSNQRLIDVARSLAKNDTVIAKIG